MSPLSIKLLGKVLLCLFSSLLRGKAILDQDATFKFILTPAGHKLSVTPVVCLESTAALRWLWVANGTSPCSFHLPNVIPVERLDPVAFCLSLPLWGLCGRIIYQRLEWLGGHVIQEAPRVLLGELGALVCLAAFARASASDDLWGDGPEGHMLLFQPLGSLPTTESNPN